MRARSGRWWPLRALRSVTRSWSPKGPTHPGSLTIRRGPALSLSGGRNVDPKTSSNHLQSESATETGTNSATRTSSPVRVYRRTRCRQVFCHNCFVRTDPSNPRASYRVRLGSIGWTQRWRTRSRRWGWCGGERLFLGSTGGLFERNLSVKSGSILPYI